MLQVAIAGWRISEQFTLVETAARGSLLKPVITTTETLKEYKSEAIEELTLFYGVW